MISHIAYPIRETVDGAFLHGTHELESVTETPLFLGGFRLSGLAVRAPVMVGGRDSWWEASLGTRVLASLTGIPLILHGSHFSGLAVRGPVMVGVRDSWWEASLGTRVLASLTGIPLILHGSHFSGLAVRAPVMVGGGEIVVGAFLGPGRYPFPVPNIPPRFTL